MEWSKDGFVCWMEKKRTSDASNAAEHLYHVSVSLSVVECL